MVNTIAIETCAEHRGLYGTLGVFSGLTTPFVVKRKSFWTAKGRQVQNQ